MIEIKDRENFCREARLILEAEGLSVLRTYGREVGVSRATDKQKEVLIQDILAVHCGDLVPTRTNRGAPVKNNVSSPMLKKAMDELFHKYGVVTKEEVPEFDFAKALSEFRQLPKVIELHDSAYDERERKENFYTGQLVRLGGVYMLLNLDCSNQDGIRTVPELYVRKYDLREGDVISCYVKKGEKSYIVEELATVNGNALLYERNRFEYCTPSYPNERISFYNEQGEATITEKYLQWLLPIGKGQRACLVGAPKTGKSWLLAQIASQTAKLNKEMCVMVFLTGEAPEIISLFSDHVSRENVLTTSYTDTPEKKVYAAEFILRRAQRYAESGKDVLLLVDSLGALAEAYEETDFSGGNTPSAGISAKTVRYMMGYFSMARRLKEGGSLTIIGSVTSDSGNPADDILSSALSGAANLEIRLSEELSVRRVYPTVDLRETKIQRGGLLTTQAEVELEGIVCAEYLPAFGEERLRSALANSENYGQLRGRILSELKELEKTNF